MALQTPVCASAHTGVPRSHKTHLYSSTCVALDTSPRAPQARARALCPLFVCCMHTTHHTTPCTPHHSLPSIISPAHAGRRSQRSPILWPQVAFSNTWCFAHRGPPSSTELHRVRSTEIYRASLTLRGGYQSILLLEHLLTGAFCFTGASWPPWTRRRGPSALRGSLRYPMVQA